MENVEEMEVEVIDKLKLLEGTDIQVMNKPLIENFSKSKWLIIAEKLRNIEPGKCLGITRQDWSRGKKLGTVSSIRSAMKKLYENRRGRKIKIRSVQIKDVLYVWTK